jgi:hypothetical protein
MMMRRWWTGLGVVGVSLLVTAAGCGDDEVTTTSDGGSGGSGGEPTTGGTGGTPDGGGGMGGMPGADFAEPCTDDEQCEPGFCIPEADTGWPLGYCTELCNDLAPCTTPGTQCVDIGSGQFCLRDCSPSGSGEECEPHQSCFDLGNGAGVCGPGCRNDDDCPVLGKCDEDGFCVEPEDCTDAVDNDQDGLTDCEDADCASTCQTEIDATCGGATAAMATQNGDTTGGTDVFAGSCTGAAGALEEVYAYSAPGDGLLQIQLTSTTDQGVYVRSTCNDPASEVACTDAVLGGEVENLYLPVDNGDGLSIFVDGYLDPLEAGPYTLDLGLLTLTPEQEDNGTAAMANSHVDGTAFSGAIAMSDNDWIAVTVPGPASTLTAEIVAGGANTCAGDIDSELQLVDTDMTTELAFNDDISPFGNFCSSLTATDLVAGVYYLRVAASQQFCADCTFDYSLVIDVQ